MARSYRLTFSDLIVSIDGMCSLLKYYCLLIQCARFKEGVLLAYLVIVLSFLYQEPEPDC
jgi:hypothetical protein